MNVRKKATIVIQTLIVSIWREISAALRPIQFDNGTANPKLCQVRNRLIHCQNVDSKFLIGSEDTSRVKREIGVNLTGEIDVKSELILIDNSTGKLGESKSISPPVRKSIELDSGSGQTPLWQNNLPAVELL